MASGNLRHRKQGKSDSSPEPSSSTLKELEPQDAAEIEESAADRHETFRITPLVERSIPLRLDFGPFILLYAVLIAIDTSEMSLAESFILSVAWAAGLMLHLSVVLFCQWKISTKATVGFHRVGPSSPSIRSNQWTHCLVESVQESVGGEIVAGIVPIEYNQEDQVLVISFQDRIFRCSAQQPDMDISLWGDSPSPSKSEMPRFRPVRYPVQMPLSFYREWKGHKELKSVVKATSVYGSNMTILELPSFRELLSDQLIAPFFLFQMFCVVLWSLDEYWYYALFTLFALLMFESTVAYNRLQGLQRLHQAGHKGTDRVWVRRGGLSLKMAPQWVMIPTRELVPGDLVSLSSSNLQQAVPADLCLVSGSAVVDEALLTGESTPQLKHALDVGSSNQAESTGLDIHDAEHKESILFGGTILLVCTPEQDVTKDTNMASLPPENGIVGVVLRTGFETAQGSLLRTMAHTSKSADGVHTWETFFFIFLLICFAIGAASWVLKEGWYDERRNRFRLVLHVIIIITSVVPPELPMELSLAVTNSVADLMKRCQVYCTEHFRIPWAGEVDVCCFDKTGTLTSDEMRLRGVRCFDHQIRGDDLVVSSEDDLLAIPGEDDIPWESFRILTACHSLALAQMRNGRKPPRLTIVGDPLEQAVFEHTGFQLMKNGVITATEGDHKGKMMTILHRFAFSSQLKRMTTLVTENADPGTLMALTKGAPETVKALLSTDSIPDDYDDVTFHHMSRGRRVLAMGYRKIGSVFDLNTVKNGGRERVEKNMLFAGFLVLDCPLKPDSKSVISELQKSGHNCVMITGDAILTAAEVSRQVGIAGSRKKKRPVLYRIQKCKDFDAQGTTETLALFDCVPLVASAEKQAMKLCFESFCSIKESVKAGDIACCISGDTLVQIATHAVEQEQKARNSTAAAMDEKHILLNTAAQRVLAKLVPLVSVFARHAPHHKEAVVAAFNLGGAQTLMCGDGTNDVGALKRAHVGISIISAPHVEAKQREANAIMKKDRKGKKSSTGKKKKKSLEESMRQLREAQEELDQVELGDASVAAPFTSRAVSIKCCKDVVQQGRCTLVTTLQIYKILGINCLVNAMVLSRLFLYGVKQGERQMTVLGMAVAGLFFFVTRAKPLPTLSTARPPSSVLCSQAMLSILGQFLIHIVAILIATEAALAFVDPYDPSLVPDGPFNPNTLNSCTFLLTCLSTVNTFAVNYRGRPFMENLHENKLLYRSLQVCYGVLGACALEIFPPLNDLLQLTALPSVTSAKDPSALEHHVLLVAVVQAVDFPVFMCCLMVIDTVAAFAWEKYLVGRFEG